MNSMQEMSDSLKEDILKGDSKYIKDRMIIFDSISFQEVGVGSSIKIYNKGNALVTFYIDRKYTSGDVITFQVTEGKMKIELSDV